MPRLVDSHAHLDFEDYAVDLDAVEAREPGYFSATVGIHPHECAQVPEDDWRAMEALARDPRIVAVGETGLDFHYDYSPRPVQEASFRRSVAAAKAAGKPLVVHVREADEACARVLAEEGLPGAGGVIHCFTGDWPRAKAYLDLGLHLSITGVVTFKTADDLRDAVRRAPRDRVLVETDCPFLAPIPYRGKRNEPAYVARTAEKVAELWGVSVEEVGEVT